MNVRMAARLLCARTRVWGIDRPAANAACNVALAAAACAPRQALLYMVPAAPHQLPVPQLHLAAAFREWQVTTTATHTLGTHMFETHKTQKTDQCTAPEGPKKAPIAAASWVVTDEPDTRNTHQLTPGFKLNPGVWVG